MIYSQDWKTEAVTRRFDELTGKAELLEDIAEPPHVLKMPSNYFNL